MACTETSVLSFKNGLQYDSEKHRCMRYTYVNNHFIAYFASSEDINTNVYTLSHHEIDKFIDRKHKIVKKDESMWVEVVSDSNCVNEIWCRPSKVFIPYAVKKEYPNMELKWRTRLQWIASMLFFCRCPSLGCL